MRYKPERALTRIGSGMSGRRDIFIVEMRYKPERALTLLSDTSFVTFLPRRNEV